MNLVWHNQIELDAVGKAQRKVIGEFRERLARIIEKNETLPELEKMDRSEFVVDVAGRYLAAEVGEFFRGVYSVWLYWHEVT